MCKQTNNKSPALKKNLEHLDCILSSLRIKHLSLIVQQWTRTVTGVMKGVGEMMWENRSTQNCHRVQRELCEKSMNGHSS